MRRIKALFLVSLILLGGILIFSSPPVLSGGISIWPGKLTITMPEEYPEEEIRYEIEVNNLNSYDINVSAEIENPSLQYLKKDYTFIPDLSWVSTTPEILYIPAYESRFLEVIITIPNEEKPLHYDERWEVWVVISEVKDQSPGTIISIELAVKLFINTPPEKVKQQIPQTLYLILLFIIVGLIAVATFVFYAKKRERTTYKKKPVVLYFKKKKGGGSRNNRP
jgi:hypothetical protein